MLKRRVPLLSVLGVILLLGAGAFASRNSGGTYSLPSGNPVVSGTTITSTWANTTLNDIKTEITNSLDRQGRGGMLAPLQLVAGTAAAPGLTFSLEPSSGAYRAGSGDIRWSVLTTPVLKLQSGLVSSLVPLTVTGRTTTTDLTVTGSSDALIINALTANTIGLYSTGNGSGAGVYAIGGATGDGLYAAGSGASGRGVVAVATGGGNGIQAYGGATGGQAIQAFAQAGNTDGISSIGFNSGSGISGIGGATSGTGIYGAGGAPNGVGIQAQGNGSGSGISATGGATGIGVTASAGVAATAAVRQDAMRAANGDISLVGVANPNSGVAITNRITPKNITKAWGAITIGAAGAVTLTDGFNISGVAVSNSGVCNNNQVDVTFASSFSSSTSFAVVAGRNSGSACAPKVVGQTASIVTLRFDAYTSTAGTTAACLQGPCGVGTTDWNGANFTLIAIGGQ